MIVYGIESRAPDQSDLVQYNKIDDNFILKWINRNKWVAAMITYAAILLIIGASNSRQGYYLRQFMHRTTLDAIDYIKTIHVFGLNYIQKMFGWQTIANSILNQTKVALSDQNLNMQPSISIQYDMLYQKIIKYSENQMFRKSFQK